MKKIKTLIGTLILSSAFLYADCYEPIGCPTPCCLEGQWEVAGEWLYFLNSISQPYFAQGEVRLTGSPGIGLDRHANEQKWHSAYRLEGIYAFCNRQNDLRLRWTQMPSFTESGSFSATGRVLGTIGLPLQPAEEYDTASISSRFYFYSAELLFSQELAFCAPFSFAFEAGLQFSRIHMTQDITYANSSPYISNTKFQSDRYGVGPEVGFQFSYPFCGCFNWTVRGNTSLLVTKKKLKYETTNVTDTDTTVSGTGKDDGYWLIMPYADLRMGLSYARAFSYCGCCFGLRLEGGYEVMDYVRGVDNTYTFLEFTDPHISINNYMNLLQHGPYVRLAVDF